MPVTGAAGPTRRALLRASRGVASAGLLAYLSPRTAAADPGERVLGEARSRYNRVRVTERGSVRTMYFVGDDGTQYIETRVDRAYPASLDLDVFRTMMAGFVISPRPASALVLGLGGGAICNYLHARIAGLEIDAVDIDPEVVRLAQAHFDVPKSHPRYRCHVADARMFLEKAPAERRWDMIVLDAFRGVTVPYHLKTAEFHAAVLARLAPRGVVVANLHNATRMYPHDRATFAAVYPTRYSFLSEGGNQTTLVAAADPQRLGAYAVRANARVAQPSFDFDLLGLAARLYLRRDWPADTTILRDDFRPAELDTAVLRHNETCIHGCKYGR